MNIKELRAKRELQNEIASLETVFRNAVVKYLNIIVGVPLILFGKNIK